VLLEDIFPELRHVNAEDSYNGRSSKTTVWDKMDQLLNENSVDQRDHADHAEHIELEKLMAAFSVHKDKISGQT